MRECWINVYDRKIYPSKSNNQGEPCYDINLVNHVSIYLKYHDYKTIYRIHVKLK